MTTCVVDLLEPVEVKEQDRERLPAAHTLRELTLPDLAKPATVEQAGQRVGDCALAELAIELGVAPGCGSRVSEQRRRFEVFAREAVGSAAAAVEHTESPIAGDQRNDQV